MFQGMLVLVRIVNFVKRRISISYAGLCSQDTVELEGIQSPGYLWSQILTK